MVLYRLENTDGNIELYSLFDIGYGHIENRLHAPQHLTALGYGCAVDYLLDFTPPLVKLTENVLRGDFHVFKDDFTQLVLGYRIQYRNVYTRAFRIDYKYGNSVFGLIVGPGDAQHIISIGGIGDKELGAVDDIVAVRRGSLDLNRRSRVTADGLGQRHGEYGLAADDIRQVLLFLLFSADIQDRQPSQYHGWQKRSRETGPSHFFKQHGQTDEVHAAAAVFLREYQAHPAQVGNLFP